MRNETAPDKPKISFEDRYDEIRFYMCKLIEKRHANTLEQAYDMAVVMHEYRATRPVALPQEPHMAKTKKKPGKGGKRC